MTFNRVIKFLGIGLLAAVAGCNAFQDRAEFAAPQSRWKSTEPSPAAADAPPPPIANQYCYRTLASVDCFAEAHPERLTGYTGQYPETGQRQENPAPGPTAPGKSN